MGEKKNRLRTREIFMRYPEGKAKAITFSYDDGVEQDIRLIEIFNKYNVKATFNISSGIFANEDTVYEKGRIHRRLPASKILPTYKNGEHEVATHGYSHPFLEQLSPSAVCYEIIKDREALEEMFEALVRGHAYPYGTYSDTVIDCLKACGITYARTVHSTHDFKLPKEWLKLDPTCHHDDERVFELCDKFLSSDKRYPQMLYIWGHSFEFEERDNWERIEQICEKISGRDDVWYATNGEIYDYVKAYEALVFSADTSIVRNPTAARLYFSLNRKLYEIAPGETLYLD